ncbi:MAG: TrmH family RNA methyltransferase [Oscillospiraceae bacterium]|jgi:TrmH family RNA methyltransferase
METITSRKNQLIAHIRKLGSDSSYRRTSGEFVCDGEKFLQEAVAWGAEVTAVLWCNAPTMQIDCLNYLVSNDLLDYASPLKHTPGPLFSVAIPKEKKTAGIRAIVLDGVQDPGNVGTVIRTANAFSMDAVILTNGCADLYNPKTIRATMGAVFRQTTLEMEPAALAEWLQCHGLTLCGAALSEQAMDIRNIVRENTVIAIGSEGRGLSPAVLALCQKQMIIPMNPACESLNAAIAAAVAMWEFTR